MKTVAHATGGSLLLWVLALGMLIYALWRVTSALMPGSNRAEAMVKRIGYLVGAVIYTTFALTAISLARHEDASANGNSKVSSLSARVMAHTGGRLLIGVVGAIVVAAGVYRLVKGVHRDVDDELDLSGMSAERRRWTERFGAIGEIGRGVGIGIVGFFLVRAAITVDPNEATGLDGALRRFAAESWGVIVVILVGAGFVAYGAFCIATFTHRRLQAP